MPLTLSDAIEALKRTRCYPQRNGIGYYASCPVHDVKRRDSNLFVGENDHGQVALKCAAGCRPDDILAELGLAAATPGPGPKQPTASQGAGRQQSPQATPGKPPEPELEDLEILDRWPRLDPAALHGVAGQIVQLADPHTEADPVATLVQVLAAFGNMIGRTCFFSVGATRHYLNLFIALVGLTALGRKGTSWDVRAGRWRQSISNGRLIASPVA